MSAGRKSNAKNKDWNTPPKYVSAVREFFGGTINLDPCSNKTSLVGAEVNMILPVDGLVEEWNSDTIYVNPPYGRDPEKKTSIYDWVEKSIKTHKKHKSEILMLIPVATNTRHFKDLIFKDFTGICFLSDTRLKFYRDGVEDKKGAPMACCMVYIGRNFDKFTSIFSKYGKCFRIQK